jgi:hypothetical protein
MKRLIEFPLEDNTSILVEVDEPETGGVVPAARKGNVIEKAHQTLEKSLESVKPAAEYVVTQLRKLHDTPDEISVEFGIKLSAASGAILASAGVEANYKVTLKWAKEK